MLLLSKYKISGHSMAPFIKDQDKVLVSGLYYLFKKPKINDIVAFVYKDKVLIKRIIKMQKGKYLLEGDNKNDSFDSRKFGLINRSHILGKVVFKI